MHINGCSLKITIARQEIARGCQPIEADSGMTKRQEPRKNPGFPPFEAFGQAGNRCLGHQAITGRILVTHQLHTPLIHERRK